MLEHSWIVNDREECAEKVGYCECCEQDLYEDDYYVLIDGFYYCEDCKMKYNLEKDGFLDDDENSEDEYD